MEFGLLWMRMADGEGILMAIPGHNGRGMVRCRGGCI